MHSTYMTAVQPLHRLTLIVALLLGGLALVVGMLGAPGPIHVAMFDAGDSAGSGEASPVMAAYHITANERSIALTESKEPPVATIAHVAPANRSIALLEGTDPENARVTFVMMPPATTESLAAAQTGSDKINFCIPCDGLA